MRIKGISNDIDFDYLDQLYLNMLSLYNQRLNPTVSTYVALNFLSEDDNEVRQAWTRYKQGFEDFFIKLEANQDNLSKAVNATKSLNIKGIVLRHIQKSIKAEMTNAQIAMDLFEKRSRIEKDLKSLIDFQQPYQMEIEDIGNTNDNVRNKWDAYHTLVTNFITQLKRASTELENAIDPRQPEE